IGMWKQFKENKEMALDNYTRALSLGATKTLPELYETAGLKFDFSAGHIESLMLFVQDELKNILQARD
ncbi:MAG TPA: hypothetical protein VM888_01040, partial [Chitinophagaceae bacterium]|nr:hypothetical protein [Chitinophagaceae bacterium]